jgi:hypothetical protein
MCQIRQNLFRENTFAPIRHINVPNSAHFGTQPCILLLEDFCPILFLEFTTAYMVLRICVPKSSAKHLARVEFSQKCFVDLIFGHRFLSIFSGIFRVLCKLISKYNKINLCNNSKKQRAYWSQKKVDEKKSFLAPKKSLKKSTNRCILLLKCYQ